MRGSSARSTHALGQPEQRPGLDCITGWQERAGGANSGDVNPRGPCEAATDIACDSQCSTSGERWLRRRRAGVSRSAHGVVIIWNWPECSRLACCGGRGDRAPPPPCCCWCGCFAGFMMAAKKSSMLCCSAISVFVLAWSSPAAVRAAQQSISTLGACRHGCWGAMLACEWMLCGKSNGGKGV